MKGSGNMQTLLSYAKLNLIEQKGEECRKIQSGNLSCDHQSPIKMPRCLLASLDLFIILMLD